MSGLRDLIWTEKYRPKTFEDLILEQKETIIKHLENPKSTPHFIFYSIKPGTGKTSTAKVIFNYLNCDYLIINSSDERGIDTIRDKIKNFVKSLSSNPNTKRGILLDEADGLTKIAQDSLRNLMETYADNCFFIFSCNDISKIIEPIRSRCLTINFNNPSKTDILGRLMEICDKEGLDFSEEELNNLVDYYYPDIRLMILTLQTAKIEKRKNLIEKNQFDEFIDAIYRGDVEYIYKKVYSGQFDITGFNKYFFDYIYNNMQQFELEKLIKISQRLAEIEKSWNLGANREIVFLANILEIMEILREG